MAVNKPVDDNARKGAINKRTERKGKLMGNAAWTKRNNESGQFMDVKKSKKKFKGGGERVAGIRSRATAAFHEVVFTFGVGGFSLAGASTHGYRLRKR